MATFISLRLYHMEERFNSVEKKLNCSFDKLEESCKKLEEKFLGFTKDVKKFTPDVPDDKCKKTIKILVDEVLEPPVSKGETNSEDEVQNPPKNVNLGYKKWNGVDRQLIHEEEVDHREKNLCFYCHEKLSCDHNCLQRQKFQLCYVEADSLPEKEYEEVTEIEECESEHPLAFLSAIEGKSEAITACGFSQKECNKFVPMMNEVDAAWQEPERVFDFTWYNIIEFEKSNPSQLVWNFLERQKYLKYPCNLVKSDGRLDFSFQKNSPSRSKLHIWFKGQLMSMLMGSIMLQDVLYLRDQLTEDNVYWIKAWFVHDLTGAIFLSEDNFQCKSTCSLAHVKGFKKVGYANGGSQLGNWKCIRDRGLQLAANSWKGQICFVKHGYMDSVLQENGPSLLMQWITFIQPTNMSLNWVLCINFSPTRVLKHIWFRGELITMLFRSLCCLCEKNKKRSAGVVGLVI